MNQITQEPDTKQIDCPEHRGQHTAILYCYPHTFVGVWECNVTGEGISDSHECTKFKNEEATSTYWNQEREDIEDVEGLITVCVDCGTVQERDC